MTTVESMPTAIVAFRSSLRGGDDLLEKRLEHYADRLGYTVLAVFDTDVIHDLWMVLTKWSPDAVITVNEAHIDLAEAARLCAVVTLIPEAMYSGDRYDLLQPGPDEQSTNHLLPRRIPGASGLTSRPSDPKLVAPTAADWDRVVRILAGARRARDEIARAT